MEENEVSYWEITYKSCESNERWCIAVAPIDWDSEQVLDTLRDGYIGSCGDEPAYFISAEETFPDTNYIYDLTEQ